MEREVNVMMNLRTQLSSFRHHPLDTPQFRLFKLFFDNPGNA